MHGGDMHSNVLDDHVWWGAVSGRYVGDRSPHRDGLHGCLQRRIDM